MGFYYNTEEAALIDKDELSKLQTWLIALAIMIVSSCFIYMGMENIQNKQSQVIIIISEEGTTTDSDETVTSTAKSTGITKTTATKRDSSEEAAESTTKAVEFPININTADEDELMLINGIGEVLSAEIVRYRSENGNFNNIEEIMSVPGIGIGIFNKISEYIYVENPVYPTEPPENEPVFQDQPEYEEPTEYEDTITLEDVAPIELNSADAELLMLLPYVDEEIAGKIIELRSSIGRFSHTYELLYVEELTQQQVAEIIQYVYVDSD